MKRRSAGLSLVEVMVAITISLILIGGLVTVVVNTNKSYTELGKSARQVENGGYAMDLLREDLALAGFYGSYTGSGTIGTPAGALNPCDTTNISYLSLPVLGVDSAAGAPACVSAYHYKSGTDILVVRRASTEVATALAATTYYVQGIGSTLLFGPGTTAFTARLYTPPGAAPITAPIRRYLVHVYFVSTCSQCTGDSVPTLKRLELDGAGFTMVPLVEGVEQMQFDYGIDNLGRGGPTTFTSAPATVTDWTNVMAVRVNLLTRGEPTSGYRDTKSYSLGLNGAGQNQTFGPFNDQYKRHAYSAYVRLNNPSGRRE